MPTYLARARRYLKRSEECLALSQMRADDRLVGDAYLDMSENYETLAKAELLMAEAEACFSESRWLLPCL